MINVFILLKMVYSNVWMNDIVSLHLLVQILTLFELRYGLIELAVDFDFYPKDEKKGQYVYGLYIVYVEVSTTLWSSC